MVGLWIGFGAKPLSGPETVLGACGLSAAEPGARGFCLIAGFRGILCFRPELLAPTPASLEVLSFGTDIFFSLFASASDFSGALLASITVVLF